MLYKSATEKRIVEVIYEYEGKEYAYPIEITIKPAQIDSLVISRQPIKTEYKPGEEFIPMGVEILVIYKDRTLAPQVIPDGYFTYSPEKITENTKEVVFSFRGASIALPITLTGITSSEDTTKPIDPPVTTTPPESSETTESGDVTEDETTESTTEAEITTDPVETPGATDTTASPDSDTTSTDESTGDSSGGGASSLLYLWIIIIAIIIAALIALIIYYKKNFT